MIRPADGTLPFSATAPRRRGAVARRPTRVACALVLAAVMVTATAADEPTAPTSTPPPLQRPYEATARHSFADVDHWKAVFDDPTRNAWQKPAAVIAALGLRPGMSVADLGAGTGYFTGYLSAAVGKQGTVLAVETEPSLVVHLRERAEKEGAENVIPVLASFDNPRLPATGVDLILIVDTFHHLDARLAYFQQMKRFLEPEGRVAIIDWLKGERPVGPPPEHTVAREQVVEEMRTAGYALVDEPEILPYQYFLIFRPADERRG